MRAIIRDRNKHRPCSRRLEKRDCLDGPNCEWSSGMLGMWGNCRPKDDVEFTKVYEHILLLLMGKAPAILSFPFISYAYDIICSEKWIQTNDASWVKFYTTQLLQAEETRQIESRMSDDITIFLMVYHTREVVRWAKLCNNNTLFKSPKEIMLLFLSVASSSILSKMVQFDCLSMVLQLCIKLGNRRVEVPQRCNPIRKPLSSLLLGFLALLSFALQ